ncbi:phage tail protein [Rosenbergiella australiborealis]|uniref:phage tail-collar fiber domain-containing protein n=1 Tax=Rosenbergiella australiborealis TaxID=1544696 RepID=UPI001F4E3677|nr:phage tail protein [Rosenbergiella australiborealis]
MDDFYSIITNLGKKLEIEALASDSTIRLTQFVIGDAGGKAIAPNAAQTSLINEKYKGDISALVQSPDQQSQLMAKLVLPPETGGFTVREIGLLTDKGELYAIANCAAIEKPKGGVSIHIQFRLAVSETANILLNVATGDGLFLRIDNDLSEIRERGELSQKKARESLDIKDASKIRKGLVQLSSATNSFSENEAATPAAIKIVNDNANGRVSSKRKINGQELSEDIIIGSTEIFDAQAIPIGKTVNLNSLQNPGLYYQSENIYTITGKNYPEKSAGSLEIYKHAGISQIYRIYNGSRSYIRSLYNGSWSAWTKQYDADNRPTADEVGALPKNGNALSASKLQVARAIAGVKFDGTANISISAGNVGAYDKAEVDRRIASRGIKNTAGNAVNGWWKCGDTGIIFQWGQIPTAFGERVVRVNFPIAFPNAVRSVSGIIENNTENINLDAFLLYSNLNDRTGIRFMLGNATGGWYMAATWMAIGY